MVAALRRAVPSRQTPRRHRGLRRLRRAHAAVRYNSPMAQRPAPAVGLTVAVTGPTGEIGQAVVVVLQSAHARWKGCSAWRAGHSTPRSVAGTRFYTGAATWLDRGAVAQLVKYADVVVHLAFMIMGGPRETSAVNLDGSRNVFQAAVSAGAKRLVYASSVAAYGFHGDNPQLFADRGRARARQRRPLLLRPEGAGRGAAVTDARRRLHQRLRVPSVHRRGSRCSSTACPTRRSPNGCPGR